MKAILVVDMPSNCAECQFCGFGGRNLEKYVCCLTGEHSESTHLVGCPLKPMPDKRSVSYYDGLYWDAEKNYTNIGWNACLEQITGETE